MSQRTLDIAQAILESCAINHDIRVTPMKLMKLTCLAHGIMLGRHGQGLLQESIQAWKLGPVIASLYEVTRSFRGQAIDRVPGATLTPSLSDLERSLIDAVVIQYGKRTAIDLASMQTADGTPWHKTWEYTGDNATISNDLIRHYYEGQGAHSEAPTKERPKFKVYRDATGHAWVGENWVGRCPLHVVDEADVPAIDDPRWIPGAPDSLFRDTEALSLTPFYPSGQLGVMVEKRPATPPLMAHKIPPFFGCHAWMKLDTLQWRPAEGHRADPAYQASLAEIAATMNPGRAAARIR